MLITSTLNPQNQPVVQHVILADVLDPGSPVPIRSFSTSEQLVEWLKLRPGQPFKVIARKAGNEIATAGMGEDYLGSIYTLPDSPDIICPNEITFQNGRLKYLGGLRHGGG